jgi:hypothetical protein
LVFAFVHRGNLAHAWQSKLFRDRLDENLIVVAIFTSEPVIEMGHDRFRGIGSQRDQGIQEGGAIRTATHGHHQFVLAPTR